MALEQATRLNELSDIGFMRLALAEAHLAPVHDDVPVGAVAVVGEAVVASAHNERELRSDPTAHAEVLALRAAAQHLGRWRLHDVTVYSTVEPCPMCAGALVAARVFRVVYGAPDEKAGAAYSLYNIVQDPRLNHECRLTTGVLAEECAGLIQEFFRARRGRVESL
ncbi:MAG: cdd3 [Actinobacteria bacterium]|jgi:tRNA(adenine34) deaminase|nr:cdd3 [Actinomycetota bacterium]MEA2566564.1 tRNA(adenine34) deaminase [Actinomycetota bacterium]